jgi:hypothetical protein
MANDAYVHDLRDSKVVNMRNWTEPNARTAFVKYLRRHPSAFVSEICKALEIDFELGFRVVRRLMETDSLTELREDGRCGRWRETRRDRP